MLAGCPQASVCPQPSRRMQRLQRTLVLSRILQYCSTAALMDGLSMWRSKGPSGSLHQHPTDRQGSHLGAHGGTEGGVALCILIDLVHQGTQGVPPTHGLVCGLNNSDHRLQLEGCIFQGVCCAAHPAADVAPKLLAAACRLHNHDMARNQNHSYAWGGSLDLPCQASLMAGYILLAKRLRACAVQQASQPAVRRQPAPLLQSEKSSRPTILMQEAAVTAARQPVRFAVSPARGF